uniref:NADH dehydrogenase subunit 4L n=1 Tax=Ornithodoros savignyi TaxID=69826 RepID=UPI0007390D6E|nr:NADH dehydrogenase subunit 4L [Ornithodoros savignyi]AIZ58733.1 NADH dehydrogenase subunit 4L [Ornithodoros savignyi]AIZ58746.1 NADH dehydrogenase subunit 4L [Ornithodoros savignyi]
MMMLSAIFVFSGGFSMLMNRSHVLLMMLSLEMMYLGVMVEIVVVCGMGDFFLMLLVFMVMVVCEASLGLSILVLSVYFYGSDSFQVINLLGC